MGKLSLRARLERMDREAAGLPPYEKRGPVPKISAPEPASDHPGSKRKFFRLPVVTDTQGRRHVVWPRRKRRGAQAAPLSAEAREAHYRKQNGKRRDLTPAQCRRLAAKRNRAMSREAA